MRSLAPVVWREGMHIAQHHLQLRDRYFQDSTAFALSNFFFAPYGLAGLELDRDALSNGTASLIHARGVMPDGLPFAFPDDPAPPPLEIGEIFSPTRESHLLLLAIPALRPGRANCTLDGAAPDGSTRFVADTVRMPDETTGDDERPVTLARKNFRLALDADPGSDEEDEELVTLPVARIRRDRSGNFVYDGSFIPPCLQIGASDRILGLLQRLVEVMEAKSDSMAAERSGVAPADFAAEEIAGFWLSHSIRSSLPILRHHLEIRASHPSEVYAELLRLGGALCTFSLEADPRALPSYDHDELSGCFDALDRHIRAHLETVFPKRATRIELEPFEQYFRRGAVSDPRGFRDTRWYLEVTTTGSRRRILDDVPRLVKVCSARHIVELVKRAHPGLELEHVPTPPSAISPRMGSEYFRVQTTFGEPARPHPCWTTIVETGEVGVYTPEALNDLEFGILIVRDE